VYLKILIAVEVHGRLPVTKKTKKSQKSKEWLMSEGIPG